MAKTKNGNWIAILAFLVLAIVVVLFLVKSRGPNSPATNQQTQNQQGPPLALDIKDVNEKVVPEGLPSNLPMEAGAKVLQNYSGSNPANSDKYAIRVFVSNKTIQQNFEIYKKYASENGWAITSSVDQAAIPNVKSFSATKANAKLDVLISVNPDNQVTVNITYTYK